MHPAPPEGDGDESHPTGDDHRIWLNATFERLERPLIAYAMRLLGGNVEVARDCVQESFLRLCRESRSHVEGHVDAWLFKTCRNRAMDHHRQEARMIIDSNSSALATVTATPPNRRAISHSARNMINCTIRSQGYRHASKRSCRFG